MRAGNAKLAKVSGSRVPRVKSIGFRVWGLGFRVKGLGVWGFGV